MSFKLLKLDVFWVVKDCNHYSEARLVFYSQAMNYNWSLLLSTLLLPFLAVFIYVKYGGHLFLSGHASHIFGQCEVHQWFFLLNRKQDMAMLPITQCWLSKKYGVLSKWFASFKKWWLAQILDILTKTTTASPKSISLFILFHSKFSIHLGVTKQVNR